MQQDKVDPRAGASMIGSPDRKRTAYKKAADEAVNAIKGSGNQGIQ